MRIGPARYRSPHPVARLVPIGVAFVVIAVLAAWSVYDAHARRVERERDRGVRIHAAQLAGPELALHSASRWLRHPTRSEPWAASADAPAMLDLDPAGALAPPPTEAVRAGYTGTRITITPRTR
jgi:hypothetical protein